MHRIRQHAQFSTERLHNPLQAQTHAKYRNPRLCRMPHQIRHTEIRTAGPARAKSGSDPA